MIQQGPHPIGRHVGVFVDQAFLNGLFLDQPPVDAAAIVGDHHFEVGVLLAGADGDGPLPRLINAKASVAVLDAVHDAVDNELSHGVVEDVQKPVDR